MFLGVKMFHPRPIILLGAFMGVAIKVATRFLPDMATVVIMSYSTLSIARL